MPRAKALTEAQIPYVIAEYQRGRDTYCIAAELGVSASTVTLRLKDAGIARRPRGGVQLVTLEISQMAKAMNDGAVPWRKIAKRIGFSETTLKRAVRALRGAEKEQAA